MNTKEYAMGEILRLERIPIEIDPDKQYSTIGIRSFGRGIINYPPAPGRELSKLRYFKFPPNALAISNIKAWEGAFALTSDAHSDAVASNRFLFYVPRKDKVDIRYLRYYFLSEKGLAQIGKASPGSADRNRTLGIKSFEKIRVKLPPIEEQRRIAARLDFSLSRIERIEELRKHRDKVAAALAESLLNSAIESAPESKRVGEVMTLLRRQVLPQPKGIYREIGIRSFGRGVFHKEPVTGEKLGNKRVFSIEPGDLLFSNVFAWEGAVALATDSEAGFIGSHRFMTYRVNENVADASYLRHYFTCRPGLEVIRRASPGSAGRNKTLGIKNFESQSIPLPTLEEQQIIGRTLEEISARVTANNGGEIVNALRPSLLNAAFSGQL